MIKGTTGSPLLDALAEMLAGDFAEALDLSSIKNRTAAEFATKCTEGMQTVMTARYDRMRKDIQEMKREDIGCGNEGCPACTLSYDYQLRMLDVMEKAQNIMKEQWIAVVKEYNEKVKEIINTARTHRRVHGL